MHLSMVRPRFTARWLMVAVAIVGVVIGVLIERQKRFRAIAIRHRASVEELLRHPVLFAGSSEYSDRLFWSEEMRLKYESAADHPWLLVEPDPPKPD